jgi:Tfp pilus assembly protein PilF
MMITAIVSALTIVVPALAAAPSGAAAMRGAEDALRRAVTFGEPTAYTRAEHSLDLAERELGPTIDVLRARTNLALTRHEFRDAQALAARALGIAPDDLGTRLLAIDAAVELGRYDEARRRLDAAMQLRPASGTFARLSYLRQLSGDLTGAELAMRQALSASEAPTPERAVLLSLLGDLQLERGRVGAAERTYGQARAIAPTLVLPAIGLARVAAATGRTGQAQVVLDELALRNPTPSVLALRADIARASGDRRAARDAEAVLDASLELFRANGAVVDAELAIQLADRDATATRAGAVRLARDAYGDRRTVFTADALAWTLHRSGRTAEAVPFARDAIARDPAIGAVRARAAIVLAAGGDTLGARAALAGVATAALPPTLTLATSRLSDRLAATPGASS